MSPTKQVIEASKKFKRVMVANRGEIAIRVFRALREQGISSVSVYSDADADSAHRSFADYAVCLGGNTPAESYLHIQKLIDAAKQAEVDAIHPGYGFLSESPLFAQAVEDAGLKFIGPSVKALHLMGDKVEAKRLMKIHKIPTVPGSEEPVSSAEELIKLAKDIHFPIIIKAAAGGGGRGMRVVRSDSEIPDAFAACVREAQSYFGNPAVFCERYIENPRHIEFQVLFDEHGHGVHLFERDCSIQRRHQKLIEEAPSAFLNEEQREKLGDYAVRAAAAAGYAGAGTIEFICENPDRCYFMEMNTRIQVEHTVTEMITGVDLVGQQIKVAQGALLPFRQEDLRINGWGFEARINAEDPLKSFAPSPSRIDRLTLPGGPFVRVDSYLYPGFQIPAFYDSMVAKLLVWGRDRNEACDRMLRALSELQISGSPTTARFHEVLFSHEKFRNADFTTSFLEQNMEDLLRRMQDRSLSAEEIGALFTAVLTQMSEQSGSSNSNQTSMDREEWARKSRRDSITEMKV